MCGQSEGEGGWGNGDVWVTANGKEIPYSELRSSHLANIIRMLERQISEVYSGYWPNGEHAGYALEDEISAAQSAIEDLETEQHRRLEVTDEVIPL